MRDTPAGSRWVGVAHRTTPLHLGSPLRGWRTALYGIPFDDPSLAILMRHRAVLFGPLGAFLLFAAVRPSWQVAAFVAGFVSVVSFLVLAWSAGSYNAPFARVVTADLVALVCLVVGAAARAVASRAN